MLLSKMLLHAKTSPNKVAVAAHGRWLTYAQFTGLILKTIACLTNSLPPLSGVVIIVADHLLRQWLLIIALRSMGLTTIVIRDISTVERLPFDSIAALLCSSKQDKRVETIRQRWPQLAIFEAPTDDALDSSDDGIAISMGEARFGDHIEFTSGSTGDYKFLRRSGEAFAELCERTAGEFRIDAATVFHLNHLAPWTGVGGKCPITCWALGATCVFDQRADWLSRILEFPINRLFVTPDMMKIMAGTSFGTPKDPTLQIYCGGGFLSPRLATQVRDNIGCKVFINYAGTEFGVRLQNDVRNDEDSVWLRPLPNADIRLIDDRGRIAANHQEATIQLKLHACDPKPYPDDRTITESTDDEGYFDTGDLAMRRDDGRIRILGRAEDVLNIGGHKKAVGPFEDEARNLLGVDTLCLFSQQSEAGEDSLLVVIEGDAPPDALHIERFSRTLPRYYSHLEIRILPVFPRQSSGLMKIRRRDVMRLAKDRAVP